MLFYNMSKSHFSILWPRPLKSCVQWFPVLWGHWEEYQTSAASEQRSEGLRHQWTGPQKGQRALKNASKGKSNIHSCSACHSPELHPPLLRVRRPIRHRWCSGLGPGTAPSASTEGQRTLHGSKGATISWVVVSNEKCKNRCAGVLPMSPGVSHRLKELQCFWQRWTGRTRTVGRPSPTTSQPNTPTPWNTDDDDC